jgi:NitT/TauT family transport system ATP-binding protein
LNAAVKLEVVGKVFANGTEALAPQSLSVAQGSFTAIVGPSGCGKSTLLRLISGLSVPTSGTVMRSGVHDAFGTGFIFQDATLMPWATVFENIALPLRLAGKSSYTISADVGDAIARVGLSSFTSAYPRELSGGMRMRVSIARAIVSKPQLLLMDEPFAALDEFTRFKLNDDLMSLWQQHRWTVVFVTHSIREAVFLSQRVIVMSPHPGRIIGDVEIDLPAKRDANLRLDHGFIDQCAKVSAILGHGISGAAAS